MKKTFSRFLAVTLALALVLTCMISGFSGSIAAEDTITEPTFGQNLLVNEATTVTETVEVADGRTLNCPLDEPMLKGFRYVIRFVAKGPATSIEPVHKHRRIYRC